MNENIKRIIIEDEDFLRLFAIVDVNNNSYAEKDKAFIEEYRKKHFFAPFKVLTTDDIDYYNYLLDKWKNSNVEAKIKDLLKDNPNAPKEAIEESKEKLQEIVETERALYKDTLKMVANELSDEFINKTFYVFYNMGLTMFFLFEKTLNYYFYLINRYNGTEYAKELRELIKQVVENEDTDAYGDIKETLAKLKKDKLEDVDAFDFTTYYNTIQIGLAFSELLYYGASGQEFTKSKKELYEEKYLKNNESFLEDVRLVSTDDEDIASSLKLTLNNYIRVAKLFGKVEQFLRNRIFTLAEKHGIDIFKEAPANEEEQKHISSLSIDRLAEVNTLKISNFVRSRAFKKNTIKKVVSIFSYDAETKALVKEEPLEDIENPREYRIRSLEQPSEVLSGEIVEPTLRISQQRDHSLNDLEPVSREWQKVNVNEINTDIMNAHNSIASYNEDDIEGKIRILTETKEKLASLEAKKTKSPTDATKIKKLKKQIDKQEESLEEAKQRRQALEDRIKKNEQNIKELSDYYLSIDTDEDIEAEDKANEKRKTSKNITKLQKELALDKKALNNRGLFLQLATNEKNEQIVTTTEGTITLSFRNSEEIIKSFTYETTKLLRYLQNIVYDTPLSKTDDFILIDIDEYTEATGRKPSNYKRVRTQVKDALELITNEYFRITGKAKKGNIEIDGAFVLVDAYFLIKAGDEKEGVINDTGKTTLAIHLGKAWRNILLSERAFQWASIPKVLDRISNEEVKQHYDNTNALLVTELGYYLYETLRKNLKGKGYYKKRFKIKTLVNALIKKGLLQTSKSNRYSRRIIEPLKETLNFLEDIGLIEYNTNAFMIYEGDEEKGIKGLLGSSEDIIKKAFEDAKIDIAFKVYDKETYDDILKKNLGYKERALKFIEKKERAKDRRKAEAQAQLELDLEIEKGD